MKRLLSAGLLALLAGAAQALPSFAEVKAAYRASDVTLLDRQGVPLQTLRVDKTVRRLGWVPLQEMSPALLRAIVLSEDKRFYEHSGVDWSAVGQSAWANLWNTRTRGASTLTMQLAGLLDEELARPTGGRSMAQKVSQAYTATRLDARWKKSEILEAYLNRVAFRGELVGISALSQTLFGKHASGLDAQEAAVAVALLRGPNASVDTVTQRACGVLQLQRLSCTGVLGLTANALERRGGAPLGEQLAPHFARQWQPSGEARQLTPLDARLQRVASTALRRHLAELSGRNVEDGAVLVLDNATGEVRVGALLGPEALVNRFNALGLALPESGEHYGPALALGSAEVNLLGLTNAYRTLANGGLYSPVRLQSAVAPARRVLDPAAAFLVTDILGDNSARVRSFGFDSALVTRGFAAVKTGTSKDMRDNWCVGFTDRYTVGVWVGNASGEAMHQVSGVSGAAPIWQAVVRHLHEARPSRPPKPPPGVVSQRVVLDGEPPREEVFLAGTQSGPAMVPAPSERSRRFGITKPRDGTLFAIDPDIPPASQRITFEGEGGTWVLDGKRLGKGERLMWAPWPGRHELRLEGRAGQVVQTVRFEVRGAEVAAERPRRECRGRGCARL